MIRCSILDDSDIKRLHAASLRVLEKTGIVVRHDAMLHKLDENGADVDFQTKLVKLAEQSIEEFVRRAPKSYTMHGRDPRRALSVEEGKRYVRTQSGCIYVLDAQSKECRPATRDDTATSTKLIDALQNIDFCGGLLYPTDEIDKARDVGVFEIMIRNTGKHIAIQPYDVPNLRWMIKMAATVAGSEEELSRRPMLTAIMAPSSPLVLDRYAVDIIIESGRANVPVLIPSTPLSGATCPVTLAGELVLAHAENLACVVISQLARPGAPVLYAVHPSTMDMRTGHPLWGSVEFALMSAAGVQLGRHCSLPTQVEAFMTDSKTLDQQTAIERMFTLIPSTLTGANVLNGAGTIETILTGSLEQLVIDNETHAMVERFLRGIEINDEMLALDVIDRIGPGGHFLSADHTKKFYLKEHFVPTLLDRNIRAAWSAAGEKDIVQRANSTVQRILSQHEPMDMDNDIRKRLDEFMQQARKDLQR